jgi:hypothetical protein
MSIPKKPSLVKFVTSIIYKDPLYAEEGSSLLKRKWGGIDIREEKFAFTHTDYYHEELGVHSGGGLFRSFFSFEKLRLREELIEAKLFSNEIENRLAKSDGRRTINVDPGYLTDGQLILATGKNYSHRVYLGGGIFADLTLIYRDKKFQPLPWTYPDYQEEGMQILLLKIRQKYLEQR